MAVVILCDRSVLTCLKQCALQISWERYRRWPGTPSFCFLQGIRFFSYAPVVFTSEHEDIAELDYFVREWSLRVLNLWEKLKYNYYFD